MPPVGQQRSPAEDHILRLIQRASEEERKIESFEQRILELKRRVGHLYERT